MLASAATDEAGRAACADGLAGVLAALLTGAAGPPGEATFATVGGGVVLAAEAVEATLAAAPLDAPRLAAQVHFPL